MTKLAIYKPTPELLKEIRCFYPPSYRFDDWETVYLCCQLIMQDPFRDTFTCILSDTHTKVSFTVSQNDAKKIYICKKEVF